MHFINHFNRIYENGWPILHIKFLIKYVDTILQLCKIVLFKFCFPEKMYFQHYVHWSWFESRSFFSHTYPAFFFPLFFFLLSTMQNHGLDTSLFPSSLSFIFGPPKDQKIKLFFSSFNVALHKKLSSNSMWVKICMAKKAYFRIINICLSYSAHALLY